MLVTLCSHMLGAICSSRGVVWRPKAPEVGLLTHARENVSLLFRLLLVTTRDAGVNAKQVHLRTQET